MTRLIDISQPLRVGLPVWPGDTALAASPKWTHEPGCPVHVSQVTLSTHSGAHADAPLHYHPHGAPIGQVPLERYVGPCRVVDARGCGPLITADLVERAVRPGVERVLFRTYDRFPHDAWLSDFTAVEAAAIRTLAQLGVALIGLDSPSLDPQESKTMDAHMALYNAGMSVLEGLVLDAVEPGDYELIALPLPLADLDAAPVRAVLRELS